MRRKEKRVVRARRGVRDKEAGAEAVMKKREKGKKAGPSAAALFGDSLGSNTFVFHFRSTPERSTTSGTGSFFFLLSFPLSISLSLLPRTI